MAAWLSDLQALVPLPSERPARPDWNIVQESLGVRLPSDYKGIIEAYGPGVFDGFLWVLQPSVSNGNLDLLRQRGIRLDALRSLVKSGESAPYGVDPGREEILPWAFTDNGDVCFWVTARSADPEAWTVAVNEGREPTWVTFEGSVSEFLVAILTRTFTTVIFPDDFPLKVHSFDSSLT